MLTLRAAAKGSLARNLRSVSTWSAVPAGPPDPILGMDYVRRERVP